MTDDKLLKDIAVAFEYSYLHHDWVTPLEEALDGLTIATALWRPQPDSRCIWEIVLHLAAWNENIVKRIHTGQPVHEEPAWPELPQSKGNAAWEEGKQRLWSSLSSAKQMLQSVSLEQIERSAYGLPDLLCRLTHNGYHIGQITKLRECAALIMQA